MRAIVNVRISPRTALQTFCRRRNFSSASGDPERKGEGFFATMPSAVKRGMWIGIATLSVYGVSSMTYTIAASLVNTTHYDSFYYGFVGGCVTSAALGALVLSRGRMFHLHPESAVNAALSVVSKDGRAQHVLGQVLTVSNVKAYRPQMGWYSFEKGSLHWSPATVEVLFKVDGEKSDALVSASVIRKGMGSEVKFLCVDHANIKHREHLILVGDKSMMIIHDKMIRDSIFK